ncbi:MAG: hypothetical protein Kow0042_04190 [Calditrichia bacterium]
MNTRNGKNILLSIHLLLVSMWIGTLVAMLAILLQKGHPFAAAELAARNKTLFILSDIIIMNVSVAVAVSGLVFSLFTHWGFMRFYWIMVKWIGIIILAVIIMVWAGPAFNGMAALSDVFRETVYNKSQYQQLHTRGISAIVGQLLFLVGIVIVSVWKPWGMRRIRREVPRKIMLPVGLAFAFILIALFTFQDLQLQSYRNLAIAPLNLQEISDGYYQGQADYGYHYQVGIRVKNHAIKEVHILQNRKSFYANLAEGITHKITREQRIDLDGVTGATTTSKVLLKAAEKALMPAKSEGK